MSNPCILCGAPAGQHEENCEMNKSSVRASSGTRADTQPFEKVIRSIHESSAPEKEGGQAIQTHAQEVPPDTATPGSAGVMCHAPGDKCLGCDHYYGEAAKCKYKSDGPDAPTPRTEREQFNAWCDAMTGTLFSPGAKSSDFYFAIWCGGKRIGERSLASCRADLRAANAAVIDYHDGMLAERQVREAAEEGMSHYMAEGWQFKKRADAAEARLAEVVERCAPYLANLAKTYAQVWAKECNGQPGYVCGNVNTNDIGHLIRILHDLSSKPVAQPTPSKDAEDAARADYDAFTIDSKNDAARKGGKP